MVLQSKKKPCKGIGLAKNFSGCGEKSAFRTRGLCPKCHAKWLYTTEEGRKILDKRIGIAQNNVRAKNNKAIKEHKSKVFKEKKERKNKFKSPHEIFYSSTAWKYCSRYVLLYYADNDGHVRCCTSGIEYKVNDRNIHVGHYIKVFDTNSSNYSTALEFKNLGPQCYRDNVILGGKMEEMAKWIEEVHGIGTVEKLHAKKREAYKLDVYELDKWAKHYKTLFDELVKQKGNPWKK